MANKTTLVDIYEAAGGKVSEDRSQVELKNNPEPFDLLVRVVPVGVQYEYDRHPMVTFAVLLHNEHALHLGGMMELIEHSTELTLPADQVRIAPKSE